MQQNDNRRKFDIHNNIEKIYVEKLMNFLKEIGLFESKQEYHGDDEGKGK